MAFTMLLDVALVEVELGRTSQHSERSHDSGWGYFCSIRPTTPRTAISTSPVEPQPPLPYLLVKICQLARWNVEKKLSWPFLDSQAPGLIIIGNLTAIIGRPLDTYVMILYI